LKICVDTTILIDVLKNENPEYQEKLYLALQRNETLLAPVIVYGELIPLFHKDMPMLDEFLKDHRITIKPIEIPSITEAAARWMEYLERRQKMKCPHCRRVLEHRAHFLSDFLIGGFASAECDAILTRDRGIYKTYFPKLKGYEHCL